MKPRDILELPTEETRERLDLWLSKEEQSKHPLDRANIGEWISKEWDKRLTIDNYSGEFYMEEHKTKQKAIKRLNQFI